MRAYKKGMCLWLTGACVYAHLALLAQAGVHAVLHVGARQLVDFMPGRPFVMPGVRRTPAVKGLP